uniref:c-Myc-binding protein n=1 Tax=Graphocephala atropunctata TaxID=36148 RepID=A0A1B6K9R7_9HEMI
MSSYKQNSLISRKDKRHEVLQTLEEVGAMETVTNLLLMLFDDPDKPDDAVEYLRGRMGNKRPSEAELVNLRTELAAANVKICMLEDEVNTLQERLQDCKIKETNPKEIVAEELKPSTEFTSEILIGATSDKSPKVKLSSKKGNRRNKNS